MNDMKNKSEEVQKYILNPTSYSSLPYYKTTIFEIPDNMLELNDEEFNANLLLDYDDDPYFKLLHTLSFIEEFSLPENLKFVECSVEDYANHINACYEEEYISAEELESYKYKTVYNKTLWVCLYDFEHNKIAATGIAEYDPVVNEGILDWIQVSHDYRGKKIGKIVVNELLKRLKEMAMYVTVSGRCKNQTKPEYLYKSCGFQNETIWHILTKKI